VKSDPSTSSGNVKRSTNSLEDLSSEAENKKKDEKKKDDAGDAFQMELPL
jgi:hypothetical protein